MATKSLHERVTALEETVAGLQNLPNDLAEFRRETNARFGQVERRISEESEQLYALHGRLEPERDRANKNGPNDLMPRP